jgi:hypothetical protein
MASLIYTLTNDVGRLAGAWRPWLSHWKTLPTNDVVSGNVAVISDNLDAIATNVRIESKTMNNMVKTMDNINRSMTVMTVPMFQMRNDLREP